jgi:hypothetical protein
VSGPARCSACGVRYRKGTTIHVCDVSGAIKRARVCPSCAKKAVLLLVQPLQASRCITCGSPATTCVGCAIDSDAKKARDPFKKAIAELRKLAILYADKDHTIHSRSREDADHNEGKIDGLEQAIGILEKGDFR